MGEGSTSVLTKPTGLQLLEDLELLDQTEIKRKIELLQEADRQRPVSIEQLHHALVLHYLAKEHEVIERLRCNRSEPTGHQAAIRGAQDAQLLRIYAQRLFDLIHDNVLSLEEAFTRVNGVFDNDFSRHTQVIEHMKECQTSEHHASNVLRDATTPQESQCLREVTVKRYDCEIAKLRYLQKASSESAHVFAMALADWHEAAKTPCEQTYETWMDETKKYSTFAETGFRGLAERYKNEPQKAAVFAAGYWQLRKVKYTQRPGPNMARFLGYAAGLQMRNNPDLESSLQKELEATVQDKTHLLSAYFGMLAAIAFENGHDMLTLTPEIAETTMRDMLEYHRQTGWVLRQYFKAGGKAALNRAKEGDIEPS